MSLGDDDRDALDRTFAFADVLRRPRATRRAPPRHDAEVVILMGIPGAGKSTRARELVAQSYHRLNRDEAGGTLAKIAAKLDTLLQGGARKVVLDNTYAARSDRNLVIETAWRHRIPVRCVWLDTPIEDARINAIDRILATHGRLLEPDELKRAPKDAIPPRAQHDFERELEPPIDDEGFTTIERVAFSREADHRDGPQLVLVDIDRIRPIERLRDLHREGARLVAWAWRPSPTIDRSTEERQLADALGLPLTLVTCTHPAGPPVCWCRPPLPGLVRAAIHVHGTDAAHTRMLGADANAERFAIAAGIAFERVDT